MTLAILDEAGPACHITTIADMAARPLDLSHLPEFAFSPRAPRPEAAPRLAVHRTNAHIGPMVPPTISNPRTLHEKRIVKPSEECRLQLRSMWDKTPTEYTEPPMGTAPTLEGLGKFLARASEIQAIADTQFLELPTVGQELAATGLSAVSLSSSDDDDDIGLEAPDDIAEHHACRYGTAYTTMDLAPMVRLVEREHFFYECGPVHRVRLIPEGTEVVAEAIGSKLPADLVNEMGARIWKALDYADGETIANDQLRTQHYGVVGSILYGVTKGDHPGIEQSMDVLGAEDLMTDDRDGGPEELGLHEVVEVNYEVIPGRWWTQTLRVAYEPTEEEFWPETMLAD